MMTIHKYEAKLSNGEVVCIEQPAPVCMPKTAVDPIFKFRVRQIEDHCKTASEIPDYVAANFDTADEKSARLFGSMKNLTSEQEAFLNGICANEAARLSATETL